MTGITNPAEEYFKDGGWGWDGTRWRKDNLKWGYYDRWAENLGGVSGGAGFYLASTVAVPTGQVYVANFIFIRNNTGARGVTLEWFNVAGAAYFCSWVAGLAISAPLIWNGGVVLKATDNVSVYMAGTVLNDVMEAGVMGYKMLVT